MVARNALVLINGQPAEMPAGDSLNGASGSFASDREVSATKAVGASDSRVRNPFTINYIKNPDSELDVSPAHAGWVEYADAAGKQPVDGTGGSPVSALNGGYADTGLRGVNTFRFVKVTGASRQGEGFSYDFTIDGADKNRSLTVAFEVLLNGSSYVSGDMSVWVYDVTNSRLCPISGANSIVGPGRFVAQFSTSDSASYRLCLHVSSVATGEWQLRFDDFYVGPTYLPSAPAMSDWQDGGAVGISWSGGGGSKGTTSTDKAKWRRVGDSADVDIRVVFSGAGSAGTGIQLIDLPAGLVADSSLSVYTGTDCAAAQQAGIGDASVYATTGAVTTREGFAYLYSSTKIAVSADINYTLDTSNRGGVLQATYWGIYGSGDGLFIRCRVKIQGWSGSTAVQPGSRYLWAQRFAANAVRVTTTPSKPGEYRARRLGTDTAPTTTPSASDGLLMERGSGISAGGINLWDVYIGPGKIVQPQFYLSAGRTGFVWASLFVNGGATDTYNGSVFNYDPATGVATVWSFDSTASAGVNISGAGVTQCRFDFLVSDDPVPVALAPAVYFIARTASTQALTASVTDIIFGTVDGFAGGGYNAATGVFTCPEAGLYRFTLCHYPNSLSTCAFFKNGVSVQNAGTSVASGYTGQGWVDVMLAAGDTISVRTLNVGVSLLSSANGNVFSGVRTG